ncbi:hypothetical protein AAKU55_005061 [Oxalobacteraceae bacterium GrIS 1.11]
MIAAKLKFMATIPANPGFYVLEMLHDESGHPSEAIKCPVLAWALEGNILAPYPVTSEGVQFDTPYVLQPDGTVERVFDSWFPSLDEWMTSQKNDRIEKQGKAAMSASAASRALSVPIASIGTPQNLVSHAAESRLN